MDASVQIGLTFEVNDAFNAGLRKAILDASSGLEVAVEQLSQADALSLIVCIEYIDKEFVIYISEIALGAIDSSGSTLNTQGNRLIMVPSSVALQFAVSERKANVLRKDQRSLDRQDNGMLEYVFREPATRTRRMREIGIRDFSTPGLNAKVESIYRESDDLEKYHAGIRQLKSAIDAEIEEIESVEAHRGFSAFSGTVKTVPTYVDWILQQLGELSLISFKEVRPAIGREEASQLLKLKTKRGGAEALGRIQTTVRALLGVTVDAFEPEAPAQSRGDTSAPEAEMDIDDFLVEANGAGIREALRIILDLELREPDFALIEEPETHLHPGLERVLHQYLSKKSSEVQLFVATHSANFLDSSRRQNVYLINRPRGATATVVKVASEDDLLKVAEEVGLRPSTVLMFDRLIFVEGPSDEAVLSEFCRKLSIDLTSTNTAFVQLGGATKFAHYAAEATIGLLSRRQVKMLFVIDRDERTDNDVEKLLGALGDRASAVVLNRRELENYLFSPSSIRELIISKLRTAPHRDVPDAEGVQRRLQEAAVELLDATVDLVVGKRLLKPIYAEHGGANLKERLSGMCAAASARHDQYETIYQETHAALQNDWERNAVKLAPGSLVLDKLMQQFGLAYRKETDSRKIAENMQASEIDGELKNMLTSITRIN